MASRRGYLVNQAKPAQVKANSIDVREGAVRFFAAGWGQTPATLQSLAGRVDEGGSWENVVRFGIPIVFSANNNSYTEVMAGSYRVQSDSVPNGAVIYFEEDEITDHDAKVSYMFPSTGANTPTTPVPSVKYTQAQLTAALNALFATYSAAGHIVGGTVVLDAATSTAVDLQNGQIAVSLHMTSADGASGSVFPMLLAAPAGFTTSLEVVPLLVTGKDNSGAFPPLAGTTASFNAAGNVTTGWTVPVSTDSAVQINFILYPVLP